MRFDPVSSDLFARNRRKLSELLPDSSLALVSSNPLMPRNGDQFHPYRQHSDFFYLTGIFQQGSLLVLSGREPALFIRRPDPKTLLWSGPLLSKAEATKLSGIHHVMWLDEAESFLAGELPPVRSVFQNYSGERPLGEEFIIPYPFIEKANLGPLMTRLRMFKEPEELEEMKKACDIPRSAFLRAGKRLKPDMREYELESEITAEFIRRGAGGHAFEPIVASGSNALILHYVENAGLCRQGDLVLMDFGAEVNNYAADCSRTLPVGGRFTRRQRELYNAVHRVFLKARELMVPGAIMGEFHRQVGALWEEEHIGLGLYTLEEARNRDPSEPLWKKYFMHGTSHSLGMDVHDPFDREKPFAPGMVLTCEPGIYIEREGLGIRLENDILITDGGPVDLMAHIPMEADEIEDLMQTKRF